MKRFDVAFEVVSTDQLPSLLRNIISCNHHSPQQVLAPHLTITHLKIKGLLHCHQPSASHQFAK